MALGGVEKGSNLLVLPVIMSGGSGTRLWPASTDDLPKQFHTLGTSQSMLQDTVLRVAADGFLPPLVIGNHRHGEQIAQQLAVLGMKPGEVILEPFGRNTASVAVVGATWAARHVPEALVLLLPADHVVGDVGGFRKAVAGAIEIAQERIVTFGIRPDGPETGYGYIQSGIRLRDGVFSVRRFAEKPPKAVAQAYINDGSYSWNAGIFLYKPSVFLAEAQRLCLEIVRTTTAALEAAQPIDFGTLLDPGLFAACPSESIDIAIMEKTDKAAVTPISVGWADIGSWSELWRHGADTSSANVARGQTKTLDVTGSLLWSNGPTVSVVGLSDVLVVATHDHVLVLSKDRAQDVKAVAAHWKSIR